MLMCQTTLSELRKKQGTQGDMHAVSPFAMVDKPERLAHLLGAEFEMNQSNMVSNLEEMRAKNFNLVPQEEGEEGEDALELKK